MSSLRRITGDEDWVWEQDLRDGKPVICLVYGAFKWGTRRRAKSAFVLYPDDIPDRCFHPVNWDMKVKIKTWIKKNNLVDDGEEPRIKLLTIPNARTMTESLQDCLDVIDNA